MFSPFFMFYSHFFVSIKSMEPKYWLVNKQKCMKERRINELIQEAFTEEMKMLKELSKEEVYDYMISKLNFCQRKQCFSGKDLDIRIRVGDICFIDFGQAYLNEVGYLHFGLVLSILNQKALIVPMTGNASTYKKAGKKGKEHTMALPEIKGLNKFSVLFLNDAKWINTARILDTKAHLDPNNELFEKIRCSVKNLIE